MQFASIKFKVPAELALRNLHMIKSNPIWKYFDEGVDT